MQCVARADFLGRVAEAAATQSPGLLPVLHNVLLTPDTRIVAYSSFKTSKRKTEIHLDDLAQQTTMVRGIGNNRTDFIVDSFLKGLKTLHALDLCFYRG